MLKKSEQPGTRQTVGLIAWGAEISNQAPIIDTISGYRVKKVLPMGHFSADTLIKKYPGAEIVLDSKSIFQDGDIDLVFVSAPGHQELEVAGEALRAGKHVRII